MLLPLTYSYHRKLLYRIYKVISREILTVIRKGKYVSIPLEILSVIVFRRIVYKKKFPSKYRVRISFEHFKEYNLNINISDSEH